MSASQALEALIEADEGSPRRRVGIVDARGDAATFTGEDCFEQAGGRTGEDCVGQGNILVGEEVVRAMAETYEACDSDFPSRLLEALLAGDRAGGDRRGRQSA